LTRRAQPFIAQGQMPSPFGGGDEKQSWDYCPVGPLDRFSEGPPSTLTTVSVGRTGGKRWSE
jgi:hypothetical protein